MSAPTYTFQVNDVVIGYKPNTLAFKLGLGEYKVLTESTGGLGVSTVATIDVSTLKGMVSVTLIHRKENKDEVIAWKRSRTGVVVRLSDNFTGDSITFNGAFVINEPEFTTGDDPEIALEFEGLPAI